MTEQNTQSLTTDDAQLIETAIEWAVMRMKGLRRKGGNRPMTVHSLRVGFALDRSGERAPVIVAGFLHDLIEDASVTAEEIEETFGEEITELVEACTHNIELHETDRDAANEDLFRRAKQHGRDAIAVKVADAGDNMASIESLPTERQQDFLKRGHRWLKLGEHYLGPQHGLVARLARRPERAEQVVA